MANIVNINQIVEAVIILTTKAGIERMKARKNGPKIKRWAT